MQSYSLSVLGTPVSFKAEADHQRVEEARSLVEERFARLGPGKANIGKEKLLVFLALGLADDLLQSTQKQREQELRLGRLLAKIDET